MTSLYHDVKRCGGFDTHKVFTSMIIFLFIDVPTWKLRIISILKMLLPNKRKINSGIKWNNNPDKKGSTVNKTAAFKEIFYVS